MSRDRLIFVYNADSGRLNLAFDIAHKILSPSTYSCALCALSHGYFRMHRAWKEFVGSLGLEIVYLHRNQLSEHHHITEKPPLILLGQGDKTTVLLDSEAISRCTKTEQLQRLILDELSKISKS